MTTREKINDYHMKYQGKEYRRIAPPRQGVAIQIPGEWDYYYELKNGNTWHPVKSLVIRGELDRLLTKELEA